jgi:hypothetical protein
MLAAMARRALLHEPAVRREVDEIVSGVGRFRAAVADFDAAVRACRVGALLRAAATES